MAIGFGIEAKIGYFRQDYVDGCAYDWAPYKVQLKLSHYQTIDWLNRLRCVTITNACIEVERYSHNICLYKWMSY